ncbi:uncharacterized protein LOC126880583 isoform X1 [Diabrotica virgifera virgifera]|uniref:Uncharacterized protein n=2 Tax=Diabrotica virgifera virgifera TaxID=50390 RepID=A0ABM5JRC9_DIAVI|nr:uncharacterized protein LOC126880583 isoform X1 [Diabrotica virgifera virgifera]
MYLSFQKMDNKEKKKRYFEKLRLDPQRLAAHQEKERQRVKAVRAKERDLFKDRPDILESKRKYETLRKQKQRERKRLAKLGEESNFPSVASELGSYKRPQSLGKAVNRVKKVLPDSPSKKQAVVRKLILEYPNLILTKPPRKCTTKLSDEVKKTVKDFFIRDDISYQAPGKRDTKSIKDPVTNKRANVQKRFLVMSVKEAYQQFIQETGLQQVTKTTFYDLRPKHVLLVSDTPHTVCVCKYHGNFNYLLESLHSNKVLNQDLVPNGKELLRKLVCSLNEENCMLGTCSQCKSLVEHELAHVLTVSDYDEGKIIVWKQWVDIEKRPKQVEHSGTVKDVICEIKKQLPTFRVHCYIKNVQSEEFEARRLENNPKSGTLQIDFAENFSLISQDEIQSAHWSHQQVTLFTACVWTGSATSSYTIVSDDLSHQKLSIKVFLYRIIEDILKRFPNLEKLSIFSDGPSSQFKNKYTAGLLCSMQKHFKIDFDWLFFATSHGKGSVDAIGGAIKHRVWIKIKSRQRTISNPFEFYECAKEEIKGTHIIFLPEEDVQNHAQEMEKKWADIKSIPDIRQCHYFMPYDSTSILVARTAKSLMTKHIISKEAEEDLSRQLDLKQRRLRYEDVYSSSDSDDDKMCTPTALPVGEETVVGSWVGVIYDSQWYPGIVENKSEKDITVSFMARVGQRFFWPSKPDIQTLHHVNIMCRIKEPPHPVSNRHFEINGVSLYDEIFKKLNV